MSVEVALGGWCAVEPVVQQRWPGWTVAEPVLGGVAGPDELRAVVSNRDDPAYADSVLAALVRLAVVDAGDDEVAAHVVALVLAPSARGIAARLARQERVAMTEAESVVAGQLWLHARCYPWRRRPRAVAVNILWDTRLACLRELDPRSGLVDNPARRIPARCPSAWLEEAERVPDPAFTESEDPGLSEMLAWASASGRITPADRDLLWDLVVTATAQEDLLHTPRRGLCSVRATESVAARWGMSGRTVRRRRDHVVAVLTASRGDFLTQCA